VAVVLAMRGWTIFAGYCIFLAAVFDFLDGLAARLLKAYSEIGKQLDSLSDMVSFGLAPAVMLHVEMDRIFSSRITGGFDTLGWEILTFLPFILTLCSALRLAKFNVDIRQTDKFLGLPTPASALLITAFLMYAKSHIGLDPYINDWNIVTLMTLLSALMISDLPMLALKFKGFTWGANKPRYIFLTICLLIFILTICLREEFTLTIVLIVVSYVLYSLLLNLFKPIKK
jgi:CDP-diacylglycerol--serine O-phosphatidyltransferase